MKLTIIEGAMKCSPTSLEPRGEPDPSLDVNELTTTCFSDPFFEVSSEVLGVKDAPAEH